VPPPEELREPEDEDEPRDEEPEDEPLDDEPEPLEDELRDAPLEPRDDEDPTRALLEPLEEPLVRPVDGLEIEDEEEPPEDGRE
jgi:hypothetical protein